MSWRVHSYAFYQHIFKTLVQSLTQSKLSKFSRHENMNVRMFDNSLDNSQHTEYKSGEPIELDFHAQTHLVKKKIKDVCQAKSKVFNNLHSNAKGTMVLPIYQLFKNKSVHESFTCALFDIVHPKSQKETKNEDEKVNELRPTLELSNKLRMSTQSKLKGSQNRGIEETKTVQEEIPIKRTDPVSIEFKLLSY